jgi:hypothetical protein
MKTEYPIRLLSILSLLLLSSVEAEPLFSSVLVANPSGVGSTNSRLELLIQPKTNIPKDAVV